VKREKLNLKIDSPNGLQAKTARLDFLIFFLFVLLVACPFLSTSLRRREKGGLFGG